MIEVASLASPNQGLNKLHIQQQKAPQPSARQPRVLNDVLYEKVESIPDTPLVGYCATDTGTSDYVYYTPRQLDRFANGAANVLIQNGLEANTTKANKVVALLAPSNLDYVVTIFALLRMRCSVLLLSTRLATEAYINLLEKTNCHHVIVSTATARHVSAIEKLHPVSVTTMPSKGLYDSGDNGHSLELPPEDESASQRIAFIIHSSGSTGLPKPIFQTHAACLGNYTNGSGFKAFVTLPLFHNHGLSTFFRSVCTGVPVALYNAALPLTAPSLISALETVKPGSFHGVPYALKLLAESSCGIELLAKCKLVLFGGSSCPDDLGDKLVNAGVYLVSHYGATEMGQLMTSFRSSEDKAWNYVRPLPAVMPYLLFDPAGDDVFELVVLDGWKSKVSSNSDDPPNSFRTSDLFSPHPTIPNAWKYVSRNDDRITLVNGEKVLPVPFENHVRQNELIREALLFGVGKSLPGLLLVPSEKAATLSKENFIALVWPSIKVANSRAEAFGQISKDMIEVLEYDVQYPATDKGTMIRAASYRRFADVIENVYKRFEGDDGHGTKRLVLPREELIPFLIETFKEITTIELEPWTDFFNAGIDSLQAITIRAILKRKLDVGASDLSQNIIFEHPTVEKLADHLHFLKTGEIFKVETELEAMPDLITEYSRFTPHVPRKHEVLLLSGTTGSLGAHILAQVLSMDHVSRVYCPVRATSTSEALDRILSTLCEKGLLPFKNISKIVALPSDFSREDFGFPPQVISDLRDSLTKVIHSAWAVNFNLGVRSFEQQHIRGVSNLIKLCLSVHGSTPAQFFFCSSISAAAGTPLPASIVEGHIPELEHAQNMGYARSKLISERIIHAAAMSTGMVAKVLRVGQIIGDSSKGIWNTTEAIPLMIQCAKTMHALPALDETPSWLPVDMVASTILDLSGIRETDSKSQAGLHDPEVVYHVQNPHLFHWTKDLLPALQNAGLDFEIVPQREWIKRLRTSESDPAKNPAIKLQDFFADKYDNDRPGRSGLHFQTEKTEAASETMNGGFDVIESGIMTKIVKSWQERW